MAKVTVRIKHTYRDKKGEAPILVNYSHLYDRWPLNTFIRVNPDAVTIAFDDDLEVWRLVATRPLSKSERIKLQHANHQLQIVIDRVNKSIHAVKEKLISLSPAHVRAEYEKDPQHQMHIRAKTVQDWYKEFINAKEVRIGAGINSYKSTYEHFRDFMRGQSPLVFSDLNKAWLESFRTYLVNQKHTGSTIHKQFKNFRIFLNWVLSEDEDGNIRIPPAYKKFMVRARFGDPIGLRLEQFQEFFQLDLSQRTQLELTRDLFIFGVAIGGPRHGDLKRLGESLRKNGFSIQHHSITYFEGKTGNAHQEIMVNKMGMDILKKYNFQFPYVPSNQRMNKNLQTIARLLKWDEIKKVPVYDSFGKLNQVREIPLQDIFSTKFMRKTAATLDNYAGIPIKTSMHRTGHRTFSAFSRYVDINQESLIAANVMWDKLYDGFSHHSK